MPSLLTALVRIGAIGILLIGCSRLPAASGTPTFRADTLVGPDTWSFTDLTLRPSLQQALYAKDVMDLLDDALGSVGADLHQLPTPSGALVDFERDVLPHLDGEVVVALSGPSTEPLSTVLIHTNDVDGSLRLFAEEAQPKLTRDARGATHYDRPSGPEVVAGYKGWLVYTHSNAALEQIFDRIDGKGGPTLATDGRYRSVVDRLTGDRIGYGYLDLAPLLEQVSGRDARYAEAFQARGRMAYSFEFAAGPEADVRALGIRAEYIPDAPRPLPRVASGDALQAMDRLPKGSIVAVAGASLGLWTDSLLTLSDDELLPDAFQTLLREFAGPYALGVTVPTAEDMAASDGLSNVSPIAGVFFLAQLVPDADVDQLQEVGTAIAESVAAKTDESGGWQSEVVIDQSWLALNAVAAPAQLDQLPQDLLASDRMYQWVRPGFANAGTNIYLNIDALTATFAQQLGSTEGLATVSPVRVLGITTQTEGQGEGHAHIQVLLSAK